MRKLVALFLIVLTVAAFATTASAKVRGEVVWEGPGHHGKP